MNLLSANRGAHTGKGVDVFRLQNKASYLAVRTRKMADTKFADHANGDDLAWTGIKRHDARTSRSHARSRTLWVTTGPA
jgi:hypothetical protein